MIFKEYNSIRSLLLSLVLLCSAQNEDIPSIEDPFPADPGPEEPPITTPPYTGCPAECAARLDAAIQTISNPLLTCIFKKKRNLLHMQVHVTFHLSADLQKQLGDLEVTVNSKLDSTDGSTGSIPDRLSKVETYLFENMVGITNKLTIDLTTTSDTLHQEISDTRTYIDNQIQALTPTETGGNGNSEQVYTNITSRLDDLEYRKVQTLINENNVWRKNFEVVNKTFSKLKKSSYSNDVIVVG